MVDQTINGVTITKTDGNESRWVLNMASEYAIANGLTEMALWKFYRSAEYKNQVTKNYRGVAAVNNADINANT